MGRGVSIGLGGADLARPLLDEICRLYDEVFSAPPFFWRPDESRLHRERLVGLLAEETFGIVTAHDDGLVGFAYGFAVPAGTQRWARLRQPVPAPVSAEWPGRTFLFFDYGVRSADRGRGVGRRLHDTLLGSRSEERATLTVQPTAVATKRIYEHWGWRQVGQLDGAPTSPAPVFDVYLRDNLDDLRQGQAAP